MPFAGMGRVDVTNCINCFSIETLLGSGVNTLMYCKYLRSKFLVIRFLNTSFSSKEKKYFFLTLETIQETIFFLIKYFPRKFLRIECIFKNSENLIS